MSSPGTSSRPVAAWLTGAVLAALTLILAAVPAGAAGSRGPAVTVGPAGTPLTVRLVQLSPATIPTKGRLVLAGTVRNDSGEAWQGVNILPFLSSGPMTTRAELAAAAASDPATEVGPRLTGPGQFATVGDLAPGQTARFRISLRVADLPITRQPGVYWVGVHALGANAQGSDNLADGRARTFIPLVRDPRPTSVALVVPLRERVRRDPAGRLLSPDGLAASFTPDGRLGRVAGFLASAGAVPVTLLSDPAVLDAAGSLVAGNPPLSLGTGTSPGGTPTPTPSTGTSPSDSASRSLARSSTTDTQQWLNEVLAVAGTQTVLGLGYDDPDTASLARRRPTMLALTARLAATTFSRLGIPAVPTVAPADGWLGEAALGRLPAESTVLVSDQSVPHIRTRWRTKDHQDLVFADAAASAGGPGPGDRLSALALRQRLISEAALRSMEGLRSPLVVDLPSDWNPGPGWQAADFFGSLDQPWLNLISLTPGPAAGTPVYTPALPYPAEVRHQEIGTANILAGRDLVRTATALSQLLRSTNDVAHLLMGTAVQAVSFQARSAQAEARRQVLAADTSVRSLLSGVQVTGTDFVTLSGGSGTLAVTLVNGLAQPVTVGIRARTSTNDVRIVTPRPVQMAPGERIVLRLEANADSIGVHQVTLTPVTSGGLELGTPLTFNLRTSQVGRWIWVTLIAGALLLVLLIVRRIRRGLKQHSWRERGAR